MPHRLAIRADPIAACIVPKIIRAADDGGAAFPRRNIMADRVSASITIGGNLPAALLPDLLAAIEQEGLSTE